MSKSMAELIAELDEAGQKEALADFDATKLIHDWRFWGRPEQFAPEGRWNVWLIIAGRGFGKTRAGAEWVIDRARENPGCRIALAARTTADALGVMVNGESGILTVSPPDFMPKHKVSDRTLTWPNGSVAQTFSAEEPDQIRGPQFHFSWADEAAAWKFVKDTSGLNAWDNLRIATRLPRSNGLPPQTIATTTPKRTPFMEELLEEADENKERIVITRGSTFDNAAHLDPMYLQVMEGVYGDTRLAQQELFGIMLDNVEGALFDTEMVQNGRVPMTGMPPLRVVAVDPSVAENPKDECGIIVVGATQHKMLTRRQAYVLEDATVHGSPDVWAKAVVATAKKWACPIVVEKNQGHALLSLVLHNIDPSLQIFPVQSYVGKSLRAEPVAMLYDQRRVHHVGPIGAFPYLEAQMTGWVPGETKKSPDRLDALVHGVTALLITPPKSMGNGGLRASSPASRRLPQGRGAGMGRVAGRSRRAA